MCTLPSTCMYVVSCMPKYIYIRTYLNVFKDHMKNSMWRRKGLGMRLMVAYFRVV